MSSNVIFQISTVLLALALAAVLISVYVMPDERPYSYPDVNDGLIEVDSFDIVDEYSGSSATGRIFAIDDGEFKARLVADINVVDGDWGGFGINAYDHLVVDSIYCEFNGSTDHGGQHSPIRDPVKTDQITVSEEVVQDYDQSYTQSPTSMIRSRRS